MADILFIVLGREEERFEKKIHFYDENLNDKLCDFLCTFGHQCLRNEFEPNKKGFMRLKKKNQKFDFISSFSICFLS